MILLFGGTTEGKKVAGFLEEIGRKYIYSTRTPVQFEGKGIYRHGALNKDELKVFCRENKISRIIDACHPFATELHKTVASIHSHIPVIRFERQFPERIEHPLVYYVSGYEDALILVSQLGITSMLALSGVQSIPVLKPFWEKYPCWFRILDRDYSKELAELHQFPQDRLLYGLPQDQKEEENLYKELEVEVVLTKESGDNGKLDDKIKAALACGIGIIILKRPLLPENMKVVHDLKDLLTEFHLD